MNSRLAVDHPFIAGGASNRSREWNVADEEKSLEDIFREMQRGRAYRVTVDHKETGKTTIAEQIVEVDANGEDCQNND
jgi:hypothetical protein